MSDMRELIERLESRTGVDSKVRMKWKLDFPFHSVQDVLDGAYPGIPAGSNKIPERYNSNKKVAKDAHKKWYEYVRMVEKNAKDDKWLMCRTKNC